LSFSLLWLQKQKLRGTIEGYNDKIGGR
jgi:hypothetical protein